MPRIDQIEGVWNVNCAEVIFLLPDWSDGTCVDLGRLLRALNDWQDATGHPSAVVVRYARAPFS